MLDDKKSNLTPLSNLAVQRKPLMPIDPLE